MIKEVSKLVEAAELKKGQFGKVVKSHTGNINHMNEILMRSYDNIVSITSGDAWGTYCSLLVEIVPNGTLLEITDNE